MNLRYFYLFLFVSFYSFAQGEANNWFFGQNAGINFNTSSPTILNGKLNTNEGCTSFSDKFGNLLFYSDGLKIWNKNHKIMPNGNYLLGNPSSTQSAIIVPHPGNINQYFIFTVGSNYQGDPGLNFYTIDMTKDGGLGDIVSGPVNLSDGLDENWTEKITSVKGSECSTFWAVSLVNNTYYSYKIDQNGVNINPVISTVKYNTVDVRGYLKVSPDGKKLANATFNLGRDANSNRGKLHLYDFDDTNGKVLNNGIELISSTSSDGEPYGVEFSPQSNKLYTSTFNGVTNKLFQFDLESSNIPASKTKLNSETGYRGGIQLAPNGKIYVTIPIDYGTGTQFLDVINYPDEKGYNSNFQKDALDLGSGRAMQGLPPFIASLLLPIEITDQSTNKNINNTIVKKCIGDNYRISTPEISGAPEYQWTFKDSIISTSKILNLSNLDESSEGTYFLEIKTVDKCDFKIQYNGNVTLHMYKPPSVVKPTNILECDNDNDGFFKFDLDKLKNSEILNGQSDLDYEVHYFRSKDDALNDKNAISGLYENRAAYSTDTIFIRLYNKNNADCFEIEHFSITVFEKPSPPNKIENLQVCDSEGTGTDVDGLEIFDLKLKESEILNGQSAEKFTISYYSDATNENLIQSPASFQNTSKHFQTVYFSIINDKNIQCETKGSFLIEILELPKIKSFFTFKQCDEDGIVDGFTDFNLNEANSYLTNNDNSLIVSHYLSFDNANNGTSPIISSPFSNSFQSIVFARIENKNGCHRVAEINLLVSSTSFPLGYIKEVITCDDDDTLDGLRTFTLEEYSNEIITNLPSGQNLSISYYRNSTDALLEENKIPSNIPYLTETPNSQLIYVRVESKDNGACYGLGPYLQLTVNQRPDFQLDESVIHCKNLESTTLEILNPTGDFTYEWTNDDGVIVSTDPFAIISKEGNYHVIATSSLGCNSFTHTVQVIPSIIATINNQDIKITDDSINNTIMIDATSLGIGTYEFSLDEPSFGFQDEPFFDYVEPGFHTIYIQDKNGCGVTSIDVSVIAYPKFFTPNNDNYNDTWNIVGIDKQIYPFYSVQIFDRFGKIVAEFNSDQNGWNGMLNGQLLPSSDYWFKSMLLDYKGETRIKRGHFSLIRK